MIKVLAGLLAAIAASVGIYATAAAHEMDHPAPQFSPSGPPSANLNAGGENAEWELVETIPTGNPHSDIDFFNSGGETYASVGTLATGPNGGGQTFIKLTDRGQVDPEYVIGHPSATCLTTTSSVTGLQHDAEATPKGGQILNTTNPSAAGGDAQLLVDATDANGRCHDQGVLGQQAPRGGLELIDITNPAQPKEIGMTVHVGEAHTVNVDPKRPHIAIVSSSDSLNVESDGVRANEKSGTAFDGIEIVDMSSCMNFPAGTTLQQKRDACNPQVFRYRFPEIKMANSHAYPNRVGACHETEIYPDDTLVCASLFSTIHLDLKGAFDDRGTPNDFTDDKPRGTALPCARRATSTTAPAFRTGAMVVDCHNGQRNGLAQSLIVSEWLKIGAPSLEGVQWKGTVHHMGFENQQQQSVNPPFDSTEDVFVSHEAELTKSRKFTLVTDERGGGVLPGGATCAPNVDNRIGNGGISAYPTSSFNTDGPAADPRAGQEADYAKGSDGSRAIYRANIRTIPQASVCTSHVMQQIPGQNRIFMAWYSQGTQVVDFTENANGTIDFKTAGWFIPEGSNQWVSAIFKAQRNADGSSTYWGATGDFALSGTGRNAIDIYKVTLPAAPQEDVPSPLPAAGAERCATTAGFGTVSARRRARGIRFNFNRLGSARARVRLLRVTRGREVTRATLVRDFGQRNRSFSWRGGIRIPRGYYVAEFTTRAANGRLDRRRVALRRVAGRFLPLRTFERFSACGFIQQAGLTQPLFGGRRDARATLRFRLREAASVDVEIKRGSRVVRRIRARNFRAGRNHSLNVSLPRAARRGEYTFVVRARSAGKTSSATVVGRKL
jgi:hypothetical protein